MINSGTDMTIRRRIVRALRMADQHAGKYDRTARLRDLIDRHGGRDWGHRLMTLTGRKDSGSWGPPRVRDIYFRHTDDGKIVTSRRPMDAWHGVQKAHQEWRAFDSQDDGFTIRIGNLGRDGRLHDTGIYGTQELRLFRRWFMWDGWVKAEWFGLRRWLYYKGLGHAVDHREPFTCGVTPPPDSGGYSHWHCDVRRSPYLIMTRHRTDHDGPHRYRNYTWAGPGSRVIYDPQ